VQPLGAGHVEADHERVASQARPGLGVTAEMRGRDELERDKSHDDGQGDDCDDPEAMMRCGGDCQSSDFVLTER